MYRTCLYLFLIIAKSNEYVSQESTMTKAVGDYLETNCSFVGRSNNTLLTKYWSQLSNDEIHLFKIEAYKNEENILITMKVYPFDADTTMSCVYIIKEHNDMTKKIENIKLFIDPTTEDNKLKEPNIINYDPGNVTYNCNGDYLIKVNKFNKITQILQIFNCTMINMTLIDDDDNSIIYYIKFNCTHNDTFNTKTCSREILESYMLHLNGSKTMDEYNESNDVSTILLIISGIVIIIALVTSLLWWRRRHRRNRRRRNSQSPAPTDENIYSTPHLHYVSLDHTYMNNDEHACNYAAHQSEVQYADLDMIRQTPRSVDIKEDSTYAMITGVLLPARNAKLE